MRKKNRRTQNSNGASLKRRIAYSLAAGAASAAATQAQAAQVYSGLQNTAIGQGFSLQVDLNGDSQIDIKLKNYVFAANYMGATVNFFPGKPTGFTAGNAYITALSVGQPINAGGLSSSFFGSMAYGGFNPNAQFNNAQNKFIGLNFPAGANNYFGWIRVDVNQQAGTFLVKDWGYESQSGTATTAGFGVVPEPGTLGMLACGAAGILALRRKRAAARA